MDTTAGKVPPSNPLAPATQAANPPATRGAFADYQERKAAHTRRRQAADLALFASYLVDAGIDAGNIGEDPEAWRGITWILIEGFTRWMLTSGYALGSINVRLSTLKTYAGLAAKAGALDPTEWALIRTVSGSQPMHQARETTRRGPKKAAATEITPDQAAHLKSQPDTPQGRRDALLMCLLLDHGLRVGEVVLLEARHLDLQTGLLQFYRPKVDMEQKHKLTADTLQAARAYFDAGDMPAVGPVLRASLKSGELGPVGLSTRAITKRVAVLGAAVGIGALPGQSRLSAHDCRHFWATWWAGKVDPLRLQEAGGWSSLAMPRRYVKAAEIANKGMV